MLFVYLFTAKRSWGRYPSLPSGSAEQNNKWESSTWLEGQANEKKTTKKTWLHKTNRANWSVILSILFDHAINGLPINVPYIWSERFWQTTDGVKVAIFLLSNYLSWIDNRFGNNNSWSTSSVLPEREKTGGIMYHHLPFYNTISLLRDLK